LNRELVSFDCPSSVEPMVASRGSSIHHTRVGTKRISCRGPSALAALAYGFRLRTPGFCLGAGVGVGLGARGLEPPIEMPIPMLNFGFLFGSSFSFLGLSFESVPFLVLSLESASRSSSLPVSSSSFPGFLSLPFFFFSGGCCSCDGAWISTVVDCLAY